MRTESISIARILTNTINAWKKYVYDMYTTIPLQETHSSRLRKGIKWKWLNAIGCYLKDIIVKRINYCECLNQTALYLWSINNFVELLNGYGVKCKTLKSKPISSETRCSVNHNHSYVTGPFAYIKIFPRCDVSTKYKLYRTIYIFAPNFAEHLVSWDMYSVLWWS